VTIVVTGVVVAHVVLEFVSLQSEAFEADVKFAVESKLELATCAVTLSVIIEHCTEESQACELKSLLMTVGGKKSIRLISSKDLTFKLKASVVA
jgi:hypothetical protein